MKTTAAKPMSQLERYILLTFGVLLTAVGVYFFKFPNNFSTGGVSGLSLILGRMLPSPVLTPSVFVFIINMALLVVGFIFLGRGFAFSTVYCSVVLSLAVNVMERFWPLSHPLTNQPLLELCFAVLLPAVGSAILFHLDASSGGTDIIAMIVRKYTSMNIGMALMVADALITVAALFCFGIQSGLFCILGLLMKSVLVDYVTDSFRMKKCFQIITTNPEPSRAQDDDYHRAHPRTGVGASAVHPHERPSRVHGHHRFDRDCRQGIFGQLNVGFPARYRLG